MAAAVVTEVKGIMEFNKNKNNTENASVHENNMDRIFTSISVQTNTEVETEEIRYIPEKNHKELLYNLEQEKLKKIALQNSIKEMESLLNQREILIRKLQNEIETFRNEENLCSVPSNQPISNQEHYNKITENLRNQAKEYKQTISRYKALLDESHKDQIEENKQSAAELETVTKERDVALRKVTDLELCLDSIPSRDGDHMHQHSIFVDQIQSMNETIRMLEKQLSNCRIENRDLKFKFEGISKTLYQEVEKLRTERERQEISCKMKSHHLIEENNSLQSEVLGQKQQIARLECEADSVQKSSAENPSPILVALVEKMRDKLIERDQRIAQLEQSNNP